MLRWAVENFTIAGDVIAMTTTTTTTTTWQDALLNITWESGVPWPLRVAIGCVGT